MIFVDTNFWIYLISDDKEIHEKLIKLYEKYLPEGLVTNLLVFDEFLYINRKKYKIPYSASIDYWESIIQKSTTILPIDSRTYTNMRDTLLKTSLKPSDAIHVATMQIHEIDTIITEDNDFDTISNINRIWI
ncbi:MAG: type II toxin-antitoxin system VapC family toxin [Candidatus Heimdallarchaeota archaeon]|nr:type II toxin-antitoxin system VapC family toxin [Candidatus Heimdallarchaeota archaeon]